MKEDSLKWWEVLTTICYVIMAIYSIVGAIYLSVTLGEEYQLLAYSIAITYPFISTFLIIISVLNMPMGRWI